MSKMMLKMLADMAGVSSDDIMATIADFQKMTSEGLNALEQINSRLASIEQHLGIGQFVDKEPAVIFSDELMSPNNRTFQEATHSALHDPITERQASDG